jgi:hypothetical protein
MKPAFALLRTGSYMTDLTDTHTHITNFFINMQYFLLNRRAQK